jgi:hypothetical protein
MTDLSDLLVQIATALGWAKPQTFRTKDNVINHLRQETTPMLLVIDNFETLLGLKREDKTAHPPAYRAEAFIEALLSCDKVVLLLTMRTSDPPAPRHQRWAVADAERTPPRQLGVVDDLPDDDAVTLFSARMTAHWDLSRQRATVGALVKALYGHPLSIVLLAAASIEYESVGALHKEFTNQRLAILERADASEDPHMAKEYSVDASISLSYAHDARLDDSGRSALNLMAFLPHPVPREQLIGMSVANASSTLHHRKQVAVLAQLALVSVECVHKHDGLAAL